MDDEKAARTGVDELGRQYTESWGWLGKENKRRIYVRRIEVARDAQKPLMLVTDLLDSDQYSALDLLYLYWERWSIESVFQQVTEVFFSEPSKLSQLQKCLDKLLGNVWRERWRKSPQQIREPTKLKKKRTPGSSGHNSVYRILQDYAMNKPKAKSCAS